MIGNTSAKTERTLGAHLAPYLSDPTNIFIMSSDFCHWGSRFRYTYYQPPDGAATQLRPGDKIPPSRPLHESIALVDKESMDAVESGSHDKFWEQLNRTGNTVCGRHPIGVVRLPSVKKVSNFRKAMASDSCQRKRGVITSA